MNEASREIAILSLGQILAIADESISSDRLRETLERHVRQVAAIVQDKPLNKPDESTETLLSQVRQILRQNDGAIAIPA